MSNVVPLRANPPAMRNVLRGAERDAAVLAASAWYRQNPDVADALNTIAMKYTISLTAAGEAILLAEREPQ